MQTFLEEKIKEIYSAHDGVLKDIVIVIPNKRASVYIYKYIAAIHQRAMVAPEILTINEWIDRFTPDRIVSQTELLFILFDVHRRIEDEDAEDFNSFIKWGKMLLSDFDEIDRYLIPTQNIFRDLRNIKEIENWSFLEDELSSGQEKFLTLWDKLPTYYQLFNEVLNENALIYQGAAYKKFHDKITSGLLKLDLAHHYYFIGFNALSSSEEGIMKYLINEKKGTVYFDVDHFYFDNVDHEAGHFYRQIIKKWRVKPNLGNNFNDFQKEIKVIETAQQTAQAKIAGSIVEELFLNGDQLNQTAIVLADESLLIPLTRSLPAVIDKANITMGYPLKFTHLKGLIDLVFDLQFNFQKFKSVRLYHKTILNSLDHPYLKLMVKDRAKITAFEQSLIQKNKIFIGQNELLEVFPQLDKINQFFIPWKNIIVDGFGAFNQLTSALYETLKLCEDDMQIDLEVVYHFTRGFKKFEEIALKHPHPLTLRSFKVLFYQFWQSESLSFLGNPTKGLQVMGVLETRTIDFENLIILGMNEGNLPKTNVVNSFIPRDLKLNHGLPVEEDRQAIFAHHFYRLLHRAKKVYFTYNSTTEGVGVNEKSRFITQLENELDFSKGHQLAQYTFTTDDKAAEIKETSYNSSELVKSKIDEQLKKGLSPSALNKFISCPLDFYYRYVLGMKESVEVEEHIEASTFGTKIHEVLERIIRKNFLDPKVKMDEGTLVREKKKIKEYLKEVYLEDFSENDLKYGQNKLSFEVSLGFLERFIDKQIEEIRRTDSPIFIIDLEKSISAKYNWLIDGKNKEVKIEGNADRIDQIGSVYRIIDYKSGKCSSDKIRLPKNIEAEGAFEKFMYDETKGYGRQLLMYALMFRQTYPAFKNFSAGIISMINLDDWLQNIQEDGSEILSDELLDAFEEELKAVFIAVYESDYEFKHNPKALYCDHCSV
ncbi:PD-(D/E)XK nuclease family protein [Crocinitomix algicola]|uniref:PD-(D/E)XK nuclease family protein n=1 Tax=Crocinitomix algicola TaxID=1740263 RepID=UPI0008722E0D|nr:PD-(D/E)XK nuclease family protein [Crocinitomix algicola]